MNKSVCFSRLIILTAACILSFYLWLFVAFPLTMIFEPLKRVGCSHGYSSNWIMILLGIAEFIGSYLVCVAVIYIIILYILKMYLKRKGRTLEDL